MLVYGDHARRVDPAQVLDELEARLGAVTCVAPGVARHADLVAAFIAAGELLQGLADAAFASAGVDRATPEQDAATRLCVELAQAIAASWDSDFAGAVEIADESLEALRGLELPREIEIRLAEGYAFYSLYPELYLEAARDLPGGGTLQPVGIRSIGAGLAAMVTAAAGGASPITVRPTGHPYDRRLQLDERLRQSLIEKARFAVVDEGPGMSGSSFAAVLRELEDAGVAPGRVHLMPSHAGEPGPAAGPERRAAYLAADRRVASFEDVILHGTPPAQRLTAWVSDLTGPALAPLEDISAGQWRSRLLASEADWPAVWPQQERRKYLLRAERGIFLLKFVGLGAVGEHKLEMARAMAAAGLVNAPLGLRHGFTVESWLEARPMQAAGGDRADIVAALPRYLAWRAEHLTRPGASGASPPQMLEMAKVNVAEAFGTSSSEGLERWRGRLEALEAQRRPVAIDGRLHAWEWLRTADGRVLKSDALDHHQAHDLIGCQDIAWDLAGAAVELSMDRAEAAALAAEVGRRVGRTWSEDALDFMALSYAAFQLGRTTMARHTSSAEECARLDREVTRYMAALADLVEG